MAAARDLARAAAPNLSGIGFSREIALRTTITRAMPTAERDAYAGVAAAYQRVAKIAERGARRESYSGPHEIVIPVSVGGRHIEDLVVDINERTIREGRRAGAVIGRW